MENEKIENLENEDTVFPTDIDEENMTEEEREKLVLETSMRVLKKYKKAFEELAKL